MRALLVVVALVAAACSSATGTTTTAPDGVDCVSVPPEDVVAETSAVDVSLEPNPIAPRQLGDLVVSGAGFSREATIGVDARWQCWDGSDWVTTHIVYRGFGDQPGETIPVNPDFQIQVPDIALWLDRAYVVAAPQVETGVYRLEDVVFDGGETVTGFVFVEVVAE